MTDGWIPRLTVRRVLDGDTIEADDVDLGYHVHIRGVKFRILGVNAPEVHGMSKPAGVIAREFTTGWLALHAGHGGLLVTSTGEDDFGRWLGDVFCAAGDHLGEGLLSSGNAVPYAPKAPAVPTAPRAPLPRKLPGRNVPPFTPK